MASPNQPSTKRRPILGCIADDVTGATDLALNLVQGGLCVVQLLQIPTVRDLQEIDADAIVVGLKTRSIPRDDAVQQSLACLRVFRDAGLERCFFKYCSTFDSTSEGNIGPVASALLDELDATQTIFCPAFPDNGRTVYRGHLFVHDQLLNESGMEHHPLNPMKDANLVRFLGQQTDRRIGLLAFEHVEGQRIDIRMAELAAEGCSFVVTDACHDRHLQTIANAVVEYPLVTGGSRIARYLPAAYRTSGLIHSKEYMAEHPDIPGRSLIVAGSCSTATNRQVRCARDKTPSWQVDVDRLIQNPEVERTKLIEWASTIPSASTAMVCSTSTPEVVIELQSRHGAKAVASAVEDFLASAAKHFVDECDVTRLIVAGGETAGAVVKKLGVNTLRIGAEICPGVPWTETIGDRPLAFALKSGNFGQEDFFETALIMLP